MMTVKVLFIIGIILLFAAFILWIISYAIKQWKDGYLFWFIATIGFLLLVISFQIYITISIGRELDIFIS